MLTPLPSPNSGRTHTIPATDIDMDDVRETFETNVFGVMAMCQAFADQLIAARGLIVNIASLAAVSPYVFGSVYCASKGAVASFSRTLRAELRPFGVGVLVAMAGTVKSNIASHAHRRLPPGSLYERVGDAFERRLTYSQQSASMGTAEYAERLVGRALAAEAPLSALRAWFWRPDWFWCGGMASLVWLGHTLGEWVMDEVVYRMFGLYKLEVILKQEAAQKKLE